MIRTIKLRLRGMTNALQRKIWASHSLYNKACAEIDRIFLLLRGKSYAINGSGQNDQDVVTEADVQAEALQFAREAQRRNWAWLLANPGVGSGPVPIPEPGSDPSCVPQLGSDKEILELLACLHKAMFPPGSKNSKTACGFMGNIFDPTSVGNFAAGAKGVAPAWLVAWECLGVDRKAGGWIAKNKDALKGVGVNEKKKRAAAWAIGDTGGAAELLEEGCTWAESAEGLVFKKSNGPKDAWVKVYAMKSPAWPGELAACVKKNAEKDLSSVLRLKELAVLPLQIGAPFARAFNKVRGGRMVYCTPWDRGAFADMSGAKMAWDTQDGAVLVEYDALVTSIAELEERVEEFPAQVSAIRKYEDKRTEELLGNKLMLEDSRYTITTRTASGWDRLQEKWKKALKSSRKAGRSDEEAVVEIVAALDKVKKGDVNLWKWLAPQVSAWEDESVLWDYARLFGVKRKMKTKRVMASHSVPDALLHPCWTGFSTRGGNNKNFKLREIDGKLQVRLFLIVEGEEGGLTDELSEWIDLADTRQAQDVKILPGLVKVSEEGKEGKPGPIRLSFSYRTRRGSLKQKNVGTICTSNLVLPRKRLCSLSVESLERGEAGKAWLNVPLDLEPVLEPGQEHWFKHGKPAKSELMHFFNTAFGATRKAALKKSFKENGVEELRVMSFHPSLSYTGACSVYVHSADQGRTSILTDLGTVARHERSFLLKLPGTDPNLDYEIARASAYAEIRLIRKAMNRVKDMLNLAWIIQGGASLSEATRRLKKDKARKHHKDWDELEPAIMSLRSASIGDASDIIEKVRILEDEIADEIDFWISRERPRQPRRYGPGLDVWRIGFMNDLINLLKSWTLRGRHPGEIKRASKLGGKFCASRLRYLKATKDVQAKVTADLVIMSARGYVYDRELFEWVKKYPACQVILLESKERFLFRRDRSRRENAKAMQSAHLAFVKELKLQGEVYCIHVEDGIGAGWSSRLDAQTRAPGIRCRAVRHHEIGKKWFDEKLKEAGVSSALTKVGDLIPDPGGDILVSLADNRSGLREFNADLCSAQNLQRRYWDRYRHPHSVRVLFFDKGERAMVCIDGKRVEGAMQFLFKRKTVWLARSSEGRYVVAESREEAPEKGGVRGKLFHDWSGSVHSTDEWVVRDVFWDVVREKVMAKLEENERLALAAREQEVVAC